MQEVTYRRWDPPVSPIVIEFPSDLGSKLPTTASNASGILYGMRSGSILRLSGLEPEPDASAVGVWVKRKRGDIFLTDEDLERFAQSKALTALVIIGNRAGFFVREADGSLQSARSYEEFSLAPSPRDKGPLTVAVAKRLPKKGRRRRNSAAKKFAMAAAGLMIAALLPVAGYSYWKPKAASAPLALQLREKEGEVWITWNPGIRGIIEITDGDRRQLNRITPIDFSLRYYRQSDDVQVMLTESEGRVESTRFVGSLRAKPEP